VVIKVIINERGNEAIAVAIAPMQALPSGWNQQGGKYAGTAVLACKTDVRGVNWLTG
jgi:hypothetical protein